MSEEPGGTFYLLACLQCEPPLPMPFGSPAERGKWAAAHTKGCGHDRWHVWEDPPGLRVPGDDSRGFISANDGTYVERDMQMLGLYPGSPGPPVMLGNQVPPNAMDGER